MKTTQNQLLSLIVLTLSLVSLNGCGGKGNQFGYGYGGGGGCADFYVDVIALPGAFSQTQTGGQGVDISVAGDALERIGIGRIGGSLRGRSARLELTFNLRRERGYFSPPIQTAVGNGQVTNWMGNIGGTVDKVNIPANFRFRQYEPGSIGDLVEETVKNAFKQLRDSMRDWYAPLKTTIHQVRGNRAIIPLGSNDGLADGDTFYIFPGGGYASGFGNYSCNTTRHPEARSIASGQIIQINGKNALLELSGTQPGSRPIQTGDLVEAAVNDHDRDRNRRRNSREDRNRRKITLGLGYIRPVVVNFRSIDDMRSYPRNITFFIRGALTRYAGDYNFQIIQ